MQDFTQLIVELGKLRTAAFNVIAILVALWVAGKVLGHYLEYRKTEKREAENRREKAEAVAREDAREHRLGNRLDEINDRTFRMAETTIKANTEALVGVKQVVEKCQLKGLNGVPK